jgi:ferric-dicitrate binding protein FerR (iron transport regulator)
MELHHFNTYSSEDFLMDGDFLEIVSQGYLAIEDLKGHFPTKRAEISMAVELLNNIQQPEFLQTQEKKLKQWNKVLDHRKKTVRLKWFKYAGLILMVVGIGALALFNYKQQPNIEKFAATTTAKYQDTELILADGQHVGINVKQSNVKYSADGAGVLVNDTTHMKQTIAEGSFNQLIVPHGKRSFIQLSDGSKVWVNSGSRLVFLPVFKGNKREVFLEGEAYFEVAKDNKKPFYVRTDAYDIKVYGTRFDVQAYKLDNEYNTILLEGKVSLEMKQGMANSKEHFLLPSQKASLTDPKSGLLISEVANIDNYTAWKDGYLIFKNEPFPELLKRVSRYYNIAILPNNQASIKRLSGKLDLKDNPERVLDGLAVISKSRYSKQGDQYVFYE